jgi:hypothetical protein
VTLAAEEAARIFMPWERLAALAVRAPSCASLTLDGIGYRHRIVIDGRLRDAYWDNPVEKEHARQLALVRAYAHLLAALGLDDFGIPPTRAVRKGA